MNLQFQEKILKELQELKERDLQKDRRIARLEKEKKIPNGNCFTLEQAAESIGVSVETVKKYIHPGGVLRCKYPVAKKCIAPEDLDRFLKGLRPKNGIST